MRKSLRAVSSIAVAVVLTVGYVGGGTALAAKKIPFCDAVLGLSDTIASQPQDSSAKEARSVAKAFKKAGKRADAPKKVRKALKTVGKFFKKLSKADTNAARLAISTSRLALKYSQAVLTFGTQYATECIDTGAPSVTPTTSGSQGSGSTGAGGTLGGVIDGRSVALEIDECTIGSSSGAIRSADGAFDLSWTDDDYRLVWANAGTRFSGPVQVTRVGKSGAFTGNVDGVLVTGAFQCP